MSKISINRAHRQMAATAFVVVALIIPTMATIWTAWSINRPGHLRDVEVKLSRSLGLQVELGSVRYPRPGEMILEGVVFRQEEPRGRVFREVARAGKLTVKAGENQNIIEADQFDIVGQNTDALMAQFLQLIQKSSSGQKHIQQLTFAINRCGFTLDEGSGGKPVKLNWNNVAGSVDARSEHVIVQSSGWFNETDRQTRCEMKIVRKRQGEKATTQIDLATMEGPPLPAKTMEPLMDTQGWLGEKAMLNGQLQMVQTENQPWEAHFSGTVSNVDLSKMINGRFGTHRLHGTGQIQLKRAVWGDRPVQGPGWREIEGDLTSGPGKASHSLFLGMGQQMRFRLANHLHKANSAGAEIAFGSLGIQFHLSENGKIEFKGACGPDFAPDVVAISSTAKPTPIMAAPSENVNVRGLIKTLFPVNMAQAELLVPSTIQSQALQRYLPMPDSELEKAAVLPAKHETSSPTRK